MAEPISLIASGLSIADVAVRLIAYLKDVKQAVEDIQDDIDRFIAEIEALQVLHGQLEYELRRHIQNEATSTRENLLWFHTSKTLKEGQVLTKKLEDCVIEIYGDDRRVQGKRDGLLKQHRKRGKDPRLSNLRNQIHTYHDALQLWLSIISLYTASERHDDTTMFLKQLRSAVQDIDKKIQQSEAFSPSSIAVEQWSSVQQDFNRSSISALERMSSSVNAIGQSLNEGSTNKFFDTPQPVDRFYTGREQQAEQLSGWLIRWTALETHAQKQKRFVVYGVGGSGKTQFCCKFAQDNRESFWGVFWIDARSRERLKQTLSQNVAAIGKVDENENAALHWLSNLDERWLLIVDNADDPAIELDEYLPKGNRGHVLITTRNPAVRSYGNVGGEFFEFQGLKDEEANSLLLKAAGRSTSTDVTITTWATRISQALGYLALALAVAGAAIREEFCQFHEYLDYHEEQRKQRPNQSRAQSPERGSKASDEMRSGSVEATFDVSYKAIAARNGVASTDALQLLKTFAYLHCENIRFEFLERAVTNAAAESEQAAKDKEKEAELKARGPKQDWSTWSSSLLLTVLAYLNQSRSPPALPDVLRVGRKGGDFDKLRLRVRAALRQLTQCSLVTYDFKRDSYSMHPLVHKWAREVPDMDIGEQGVWSEAAAVFLSACILIPPLGTTTRDEELRKDLLAHVDHVRDFQAGIEQRIKDNRMGRMKPWPIFESGFNRERALMYAKFSIVYAQNGRWEDAKKLQMAVLEFTKKVLGLRHPTTRRIYLALATTLLQLGQVNDAAKLHEQVVEACMTFLGPDHHDTLVAKGSLGDSRYLQGRFTDARKLQEEAMKGLQKRHGLDHEDTLDVIDRLGRTVVMFYRHEDYERARSLHEKAIKGMCNLHGEDHLRTLIARENLCLVAVRQESKKHLLAALDIMTDVLETRQQKLGKEHGYVLLAMVNLAQVKRELGDFDGAEVLMHTALPIAQRNFGDNHMAYLWGRSQLGKLKIKQQRWKEAEVLFVDVTERQKTILQGRGRVHPDRIGGLVELTAVYHALGKETARDRTADEALDALALISIDEHPVTKKLKADREVWRRQTPEVELPSELDAVELAL